MVTHTSLSLPMLEIALELTSGLELNLVLDVLLVVESELTFVELELAVPLLQVRRAQRIQKAS
jgi:hypothetical protein